MLPTPAERTGFRDKPLVTRRAPLHAAIVFLAAWTTHGWRPGPGDPSIAGWIIFAAYLAVAVLAWRAARADAARGRDPFLWRVLACACVFLAVNKQLDLHNAVTSVGRRIARAEGWYQQRRTVQLVLVVGIALAGVAGLVWAFRRAGSDWRRHRLTFAGLILLVAFIGIRAASFHHLDGLLRQEVGGFRLHALIEFAGIVLLFASALRASRPTRSSAPAFS